MLDICQHNIPTRTLSSKKGDRSGKKGDDLKSKDKDSNTGSTTGAYVGDTTPEESTTPNGGASIGAHVLETNEQLSCPSRTVEEF